jgi:hypothetical protein
MALPGRGQHQRATEGVWVQAGWGKSARSVTDVYGGCREAWKQVQRPLSGKGSASESRKGSVACGAMGLRSHRIMQQGLRVRGRAQSSTKL